jgi:acetyltransferase-like isoleucine patch superfamily enzyme
MIGIRKALALKISILCWVDTVVNRVRASFFWDIDLGKNTFFSGKMIFYKTRGSYIRIGNSCRFISRPDRGNLIGINRPCILITHTPQAKITIGERCGFSGTVVSAAVDVVIGEDVKCGANTLLTDSDWHPEDKRSGIPRPIVIGSNVWLGTNVIVLKGVSIGENSVIGAGSVVTKSIPKNVVAAGNPATIVKYLSR